MTEAIFCKQKSRRLAVVELNGWEEEVYIPNGAELNFMREGAVCYLREAYGAARRTAYDLFSIYDGDALVCIDSMEPMRIGRKWCMTQLGKELGNPDVDFMESRGWLWGSGAARKTHVAVMGTSLKQGKSAYLPEQIAAILNEKLDALIDRYEDGSIPWLLIVACRQDVENFIPDTEADEEFAELLHDLRNLGIRMDCLRCSVDEEGMYADRLIPIVLPEQS